MKRVCYTIFIFVSFLSLILSPVNAWSVELKISCGNKSETLVFGFNESASDSVDEYDLPYPPPLPQQPFYASFIEPDEIKYYKEDYKSKNLSWTLYIKADKDVKIEWDPIPPELNIIINVGNESISMNEKSTISLEAGEHVLIIKVVNPTYIQTPKPKSKEVSTPTDKSSIIPGFEIILALVGGSLALFLKTLTLSRRREKN